MNKKELKKLRKEHFKAQLKLYWGYIAFCAVFAVVCVSIFVFLPEDAAINSEYTLTKNKSSEEWQVGYILDPAAYHAIAADHKNTKKARQ